MPRSCVVCGKPIDDDADPRKVLCSSTCRTKRQIALAREGHGTSAQRGCAVERCNQPHYAKGLCRKHRRQQLDGTLNDKPALCKFCGKAIEGRYRQAEWCSLSCKFKWHRRYGCYIGGHNENNAIRRRRVRSALPWRLPVIRKEIARVYAKARKRRHNGENVHVDHDIPLSHPLVCGLHVPWNLVILSEADHIEKTKRDRHGRFPLDESKPFEWDPIDIYAKRGCKVEGCDGEYHSRDLCLRHYHQLLRREAKGLPDAPLIAERPARIATCTVDGCDAPHRAKGMCFKHYKQALRQAAKPAPPG